MKLLLGGGSGAGTVDPATLDAAVAGGIAAAGPAIRVAMAAAAGPGPIVHGNDAGGNPVNYPTMALAVGAPSIYDALFGPLSGPEALTRWLTGRAVVTPAGAPLVAMIEMPGPGVGKADLPSGRLIQAGDDFGLAVEASADTAVLAFDGILDMTALIESVGAAVLTVGRAAAAAGRLRTAWVNRTADLAVPFGTRALARMQVRPGANGEALISLEPAGNMPVIPVNELYSALTPTTAAPAGLTGLADPLATTDGVLAVWSRADGTAAGAADATFTAVGWQELSTPPVFTPGANYAIYPCWSQGRAAAGALNATGTRASMTRCGVVAVRGGATMTKDFFAGAHTSDGKVTLPSVTGNQPGDVLYGYTFRRGANGNGAVPPGATVVWQINATSHNVRLFRVDNPPATYAPDPIDGVDAVSTASSFILRLRPGV